MDTLSFVVLLGVSFLSAVMGTMIGMAMLIVAPTMIFLGVPVHTAVATGRFSMVGIGIGNITKFSFNDKIRFKYAFPFAIAGVIGSIIGASSLIRIEENSLKTLIGVFMLAISVLILLEDIAKFSKKKPTITLKHHFLSIVLGLFIGAYIGILGGGGATVVILLLILIYGLDFKDAVANQKAITLPISIIATIIFIYQGLIDYKIGVPLFLVNIAGGWIGAALMLKFKSIWLKRIIVPIVLVMALKLIFL